MRRKQHGASLFAAECDVHDGLFTDIERKRRVQTQNAAVAELNGAKQGIFNGKLRGIPLAKLAAAFTVSQPLEAVCRHLFYRREPQHVHRGIEHMDADINQRPTALKRFVGKDAPAGNPAAA